MENEPLLMGQASKENVQAMKEQYQEAGWKIVEDLNDKFIDLCVDDNSQDYGNKQPHVMA